MHGLDRSSPTKLRKCLTLFALGLGLQATLVFLAEPGKAAATGGLTFPSQTITVTVSSPANVAVATPYLVSYRLSPATIFTDTLFTGSLDLGQRLLGVEANQGDVVLGGDDAARRTFTVTVQALSPAFPLTVTPTIVADEIGSRLQVGTLRGFTRAPIVISDTLLAQDRPTFDVSRIYPAVVPLGRPFTDTWRVASTDRIISDSLFAGKLLGGVYQSVVGDGASCSASETFFGCFIPILDPTEPPVIITLTSRALERGRSDQLLRLEGGGDSLPITRTATVLDPSTTDITLDIDIKPGGFPNPINPKSYGNIPVAILSTPTFDVVIRIDQASLAFGPSGGEDSLLFCNPEDANLDGLLDLLCHFDTQAAGFQPGDTEGIVTGLTFEGIPVVGRDSIVIVPKKSK